MSEISQYTSPCTRSAACSACTDKTGETDVVSAAYYVRCTPCSTAARRAAALRVNDDGVLSGYRDLGLVSEVFTKRVLEELPRGAKMATGHCPLRHRGPAQPFQRPADGSASLQGRHGGLPQRQPDQRRRSCAASSR